jgi:toxin ParE1/3/4
VTHRVVLSPRAEAQLDALSDYLAAEASPDIAARYIEAIVERCASLAQFPHRGSRRDELRLGVRTIPFRRRVTIAYVVKKGEVRVLGIYYAGQDIERLLQDE